MGQSQSSQVKGHTASYIPAINTFALNNEKKNSKVLVIGGGK